jgi:Uma2 family endonuclease
VAVVHPRFTLQEFDEILRNWEGELPLELIDGEVVMNPPPRTAHGIAVAEIILALGEWRRRSNAGGTIADYFSLRSGEDALGPDIAYWGAGRAPDPAQVRVEDTMPDLVVEVASPSTAANDRGPKRRSYIAAGVRELWLVDLDVRAITVVDARDRERLVREDETLVSAALPGFAADVRALLP